MKVIQKNRISTYNTFTQNSNGISRTYHSANGALTGNYGIHYKVPLIKYIGKRLKKILNIFKVTI